MIELKLQVDYSRKKEMKFFNDQELKEYHGFLVINLENIPNEYVYFAGKNSGPRWIWISDDLVKRTGIDFGNPSDPTIKEYKFLINLGEEKTAKFTTNKKNWMVLKTKDYFENTVKKIGFWDSEDYFWEQDKRPEKPTKNLNNSPTKSENKSDWGKIALICLPIVIFVFFFYWLFKWMSKKKQ
jgi:hypothetical protein